MDTSVTMATEEGVGPDDADSSLPLMPVGDVVDEEEEDPALAPVSPSRSSSGPASLKGAKFQVVTIGWVFNEWFHDCISC